MLKTVSEAFKMLELMSRQPQRWSLGKLCREMELPKTNVFRYLQTFKELGYVIQNADSTYILSDKMYRVGRNAQVLTELLTVGNANLKRISHLAKVSASLGCIDGTEQMILDCIVYEDGVDLLQAKYEKRPAYLTASGLAILAASSDERIRAFKDIEFVTPMSNSLHNYSELCDEIQAIRRRRYAVNNESRQSGICALAIPVIEKENKVVASFSATLYTSELSASRMGQVLEILRGEARNLSVNLGYNSTNVMNQFWYK